MISVFQPFTYRHSRSYIIVLPSQQCFLSALGRSAMVAKWLVQVSHLPPIFLNSHYLSYLELWVSLSLSTIQSVERTSKGDVPDDGRFHIMLPLQAAPKGQSRKFSDILPDIVMNYEWQKIDTQSVGRLPSGKKMALTSSTMKWQIVTESRKSDWKISFPRFTSAQWGQLPITVSGDRLIWVPNHVQSHVPLS